LKHFTDAQLNAAGIKRGTPEFSGLTQVCRQLRQEYTPIYSADVEIHVYHEDLQEFVGKGLPHLARDGDANVVGNLFVDLRAAALFTDDGQGEQPINLLPVLEHCKNMKGLIVRCGEIDCNCDDCQSGWNDLKEDLNNLFAISGSEKLQHWLETSVKGVLLCYVTCIMVVVKEGHEKDWMVERSNGRTEQEKLELQDWMADTGLKIEEGSKLVFESEDDDV
jgi:hypothetical protein